MEESMLALARKINQSIMIGNDIEITLLEIKGDQVKIGINAPKSVPIYRKEIYVQIQDENKKASEGEVDLRTLNKLFSGKA
jgi:carbon storage regulator